MFNPFEYLGIDPDEDDEIFQEMHKNNSGIYTSSMISDILGFGYNSRAKRWRMMIGGGIGAEKREETEYVKNILDYGKNTEPIAIQDFLNMHSQYTGVKPGMAKLNKLIAACTDQVLLDKTDYSLTLLEVKSPVSPKDIMHVWEIPTKYLAQLQIEMACFRIYSSFLYIYQPQAEDGIKKRLLFRVSYCAEAVDKIIKEIEEFDNMYIKPRIEPPKRKHKDQNLIRLLNDSCTSVLQ